MDLMNKFTIILPVFNDWESLEILLQEIELVVKKSSYSCSIIIINDNSSENNIYNLNKNNFFKNITILNLKKNVGSQKAIATALKYIGQNNSNFSDKYIIMDSDGEDDPNKILDIIDLIESKKNINLIIMSRTIRKESVLFSIFYEFHLFLTFLITFNYIRFGNFSFISLEAIKKITQKEELWLAYSATISKYLKNKEKILAPRKNRIKGKSKMSYLDLIKHSFNIQKVYLKNIFFAYSLYLFIAFFISKSLMLALIVIFLLHFFILNKFTSGNKYLSLKNCLNNIES